MKSTLSRVLIALLVFATVPQALSQVCEISISGITNSFEDDGVTKLIAGNTHVITLHANSTCAQPDMYYTINHAFRMWSPDSAGWNYLQGGFTDDWFSWNFSYNIIRHFHYDYGSSSWELEAGDPLMNDPAPGNPGDSVACVCYGSA